MRRRTTRTPAPMRVELIERRTYDITDPEIATDLRQALKIDDRTRIDELLSFLDDVGGMDATSDVAGAAFWTCRRSRPTAARKESPDHGQYISTEGEGPQLDYQVLPRGAARR